MRFSAQDLFEFNDMRLYRPPDAIARWEALPDE